MNSSWAFLVYSWISIFSSGNPKSIKNFFILKRWSPWSSTSLSLTVPPDAHFFFAFVKISFRLTSKFPTNVITVTTLPHFLVSFDITICCSSALKPSQIHSSFGKLHIGQMSSSLILSYHNLIIKIFLKFNTWKIIEQYLLKIFHSSRLKI